MECNNIIIPWFIAPILRLVSILVTAQITVSRPLIVAYFVPVNDQRKYWT